MLDAVVIGAGPAGLATGYLLRKEGLQFVIIDPGTRPGGSWWRMPTRLRMVSPWHSNLLPGSLSHGDRGGYRAPAEEYAAYLENYAADHALPLLLGRRVTGIRREGGGFAFEMVDSHGAAAEELRARTVVNATGYLSHPFIPRYPGLRKTRIPQIHYADFRNADDLAQRLGGKPRGIRVLLVGKRLSAGQIMIELHEAGFEIAISARSRIAFGPPPWMVARFFEIFPDLESAYLRLFGDSARGYDVLMEGGRARELIRSGQVKVLPEIRDFGERTVRFVDGREEPFDLVFYATGFRPAFPHLEGLVTPDPATGLPLLEGGESVQTPGLYFVGLQDLRNFRSRFLRGIREDAFAVVSRLSARLRAGHG